MGRQVTFGGRLSVTTPTAPQSENSRAAAVSFTPSMKVRAPTPRSAATTSRRMLSRGSTTTPSPASRTKNAIAGDGSFGA